MVKPHEDVEAGGQLQHRPRRGERVHAWLPLAWVAGGGVAEASVNRLAVTVGA
jgi:hypothetical protein